MISRTHDERAKLTVSDLIIWKRGLRERPLVENLSFSVPPGSVTALIGPSGSGKSSILNVIAGFIPGEGTVASLWDWQDEGGSLKWSGRVAAGGRPLDRVPVERRSEIGMVMQGGLVYEHLSVMDNVALPLARRARLTRVERREQIVGLLRDAELLPEDAARADTDDLLRQKAGRLSGGQRQRLAIARALAKKPEVFLLDEAFANLDPILRAELFSQVVGMVRQRRKGAVIVTHDLADLGQVDQAILLTPKADDRSVTHRFYQRNDQGLVGEDGPGFSDPAWTSWDERIRST